VPEQKVRILEEIPVKEASDNFDPPVKEASKDPFVKAESEMYLEL
jgi:hypothetical protein